MYEAGSAHAAFALKALKGRLSARFNPASSSNITMLWFGFGIQCESGGETPHLWHVLESETIMTQPGRFGNCISRKSLGLNCSAITGLRP